MELKGIKKYNFLVKLLFLVVQTSFLLGIAFKFSENIIVVVFIVIAICILPWVFLSYNIQDVGLKLKATLKGALALVVGSLACYFLRDQFQFSAVLASSSVGIISYLLYLWLKDENSIHIAAYCGSFIGMTSTSISGDYYTLLLASFLGATIYIFARNIFNGVGGKLGSIAFISVCLTIFLFI